jgi:acetolactate synthase-1/2/3 large subunit
VGTTLTNPDFVRLARAFGAAAERIEAVEQIAPALQRGLAARSPYLVEVRASPAAILPSPCTLRPARAGR